MAPYPRYALSLFNGIGGGELATQHLLGWRTVGYVEKDPYCVRVLKARITDGYLHDAPIWSDVRSFTKRNNATRRYIRTLRQMAHELVITGGFPCQPFSVAGLQQADGDERNGWTDTIRIIREIRPRWAFLENVTGLLTGSHGYFGTVLSDLVSSGYSVHWRCLSAAEVGAAHKRDRLWIVAHANEFGLPRRESDPTQRKPIQQSQGFLSPSAWLEVSHSGGFGKLDGITRKVDRTKAIGNGQVPAVAATAWRLLSQEF